MRQHMSDDVCNVKDKLHVHGGLGDAGTASMDDRDQGAVQLVHVALGEELASAAGLVLHLQVQKHITHANLVHNPDREPLPALFVTMSACVEMRRDSVLMPLAVRTLRWGVRAPHADRAISFWKTLQDVSTDGRLQSGALSW